MHLVLKTQMKLKKHNYASTAAIVLYCFTSYKSFSYKRFTVLLVVITSLFSSYIYSQQPTISGLENIHISEGATIVTVENGESKINYSSISAPINQKNTKTSTSPQKEIKEKIAFSHKKKTAKGIDEKLIKKLEQKREVKIVYNTDAQSEESLSSNFGTSKSGINNQNQSQKLDKALFTENKPLVFLFIYQEKQNVLFQFYHSLKVETHLFTRPPPTFI